MGLKKSVRLTRVIRSFGLPCTPRNLIRMLFFKRNRTGGGYLGSGAHLVLYGVGSFVRENADLFVRSGFC